MGAENKSAPAAARLIEESISELHKAKLNLQKLQARVVGNGHHPGATIIVDPRDLYQALETIDDHIHNALGKLGD